MSACTKCHKEDCCCKPKVVSIQGPAGKVGKKGEPGDKGDKGDPGADGINVLHVQNTIFVDTNYGDDGTGAAEDMTKPFKTIAAARAAAVAFGPSPTKRVKIVLQKGNYINEKIELLDLVDWDLGDSEIKITNDSMGFIIGDNGDTLDSVISGNANLVADIDTSTSNFSGISISGGSTIKCDVNNIHVKTSGSVVIRGIRVFGQADVYMNVKNITVEQNSFGAILNGAGVTAEAVCTLYINFDTITATLTGGLNGFAASANGTVVHANGKLIIADGGNNSSGMFGVSSQGSGTDGPIIYMNCDRVAFRNAGGGADQVAALAAGRGGKLYFTGRVVELSGIDAGSICSGIAIYNKGGSSNTYLSIRVNELKYPITSPGTNQFGIFIENGLGVTDTIDFQGKIKITGTNATPVYVAAGKAILQNSILVGTGTGYSINNVGGTVINNGSVRSNKDTNGTIANHKIYLIPTFSVTDPQGGSVTIPDIDIFEKIIADATIE